MHGFVCCSSPLTTAADSRVVLLNRSLTHYALCTRRTLLSCTSTSSRKTCSMSRSPLTLSFSSRTSASPGCMKALRTSPPPLAMAVAVAAIALRTKEATAFGVALTPVKELLRLLQVQPNVAPGWSAPWATWLRK